MPRHTETPSIVALAALGFLCGACNSATSRDEGVKAQRAGQLRAIAKLCRMPEGALRLRGTDRAQLEPTPDLLYENFACALRELEKAGFSHDKIGFVAEPPPEAEQ